MASQPIEVVVTDIREAKGEIRVGLFNNENSFLKEAIDGKVVNHPSDQSGERPVGSALLVVENRNSRSH